MKLTLKVGKRIIKRNNKAYEYHNMTIPIDASRELGLEFKDKLVVDILEVIKAETSSDKGSENG